jgi:hypothetical protein
MNEYNPVELFSEETRKLISSVSSDEPKSINDLLRVQAATDKSHITRGLLSSWETQQTQERKLRRLYAIGFMIILGIQILMMNILFILIGSKSLDFNTTQFNAFFISMFGEITALVLIITKYLFQQGSDSKIFDFFKKL